MTSISKETISLLSKLSCESVAEKLGIVVHQHRALCFMHDDHHPSLAFLGNNRETWRCFVCNKGGDAIKLVMETTGFNFIESCQWLGQTFNISVATSFPVRKIVKVHRRNIKQMESERKPFSSEIAQWLISNSQLSDTAKFFLFNQRKFKPHVIKQLNIVSIDNASELIAKMKKIFDESKLLESGFITKTRERLYLRLFSPCLIFPYYDLLGNLVGIQSRYLGTDSEVPRFQFIASQKTRLFNLPILCTMKYKEDLFICEGVTDCIALLSAGKKAVAIPSATILPKNDLIKLKFYQLHMYPDQDEAGKLAFRNLNRFFINHYTSLKAEPLPEGMKDYSDYYTMNHGNYNN